MAEKKIPLYIPIIMIVMVVLLCRYDLKSKESEITSYIRKNHEELNLMATTALHSGTDGITLIEGINRLDCWTGEDTLVDFQYYSVGLGEKAGTRYGFYYSPQDVPMAYEAQNVELIAEEDGWSWVFEGESRGFTKKLMDNWYYYEVIF